MHVISLDGFEEYMKKNEAAFNAENEIIEEKLSQGINGLEWLVLNTHVEETKARSFNSFMKCCKEKGKEVEDVFKDAFTMDHEAFYDKNEINWWIAVEDGLTFLSLLRANNYDFYFDYLRGIYKK